MPALGFDIGGTFTDVAVTGDDGTHVSTHKILTTPDQPEHGALHGIDECLRSIGESFDNLTRIVHATTLVTNALIEGKGAKVGLITTRGFRDVLEIGTEQRYDVYDLFLRYPTPIAPRALRYEVSERLDRDGRVLEPLNEADIADALDALAEARVDAIAICFLHAYRNSVHEERAAQLVRSRMPDVSVSISSTIVPEIREYERTSTTVANAYVQPLASQYLHRLRHETTDKGATCDFLPVVSSGSAVPLETASAQPIRLLESGPAAGAIRSAEIGSAIGHSNLLSFDMGGTTAKLCLVQHGRPSIAATMEVARVHRFKKGSGLPVRTPTVDMIEIGAGGGSIAATNTLGLLSVGPESSGADPGPACYGRGGNSPTVTDADLVLGYLNPDYFLGGEMELDLPAAEAAVAALGQQLDRDVSETASAIHRLVNEKMANAARLHTVEKGYDPRRQALVSFGGAGPVHAAGVARILGAVEVVVPTNAGVASAVGLLEAPLAFEYSKSLPLTVRDQHTDLGPVRTLLNTLANTGRNALAAAGEDRTAAVVECHVEGRFRGQIHEISLSLPAQFLQSQTTADRLERQFKDEYARLYHYVPDGEVEFLTWRVRVVATDRARHNNGTAVVASNAPPEPVAQRKVFCPEVAEVRDVGVYRRQNLSPGAAIAGPAIVEETESTTVVPTDFGLFVDECRNLRLKREES